MKAGLNHMEPMENGTNYKAQTHVMKATGFHAQPCVVAEKCHKALQISVRNGEYLEKKMYPKKKNAKLVKTQSLLTATTC